MARNQRRSDVLFPPHVLAAWVDHGWLQCGSDRPGLTGVHLARAQMIMELQRDLGVNEESVPIILDLVDQIYGLRRRLAVTLSLLRAEGEPISVGGPDGVTTPAQSPGAPQVRMKPSREGDAFGSRAKS
ncbi:MAG: hypothetical protein ABWY78_15830 [Microvirga sp.]